MGVRLRELIAAPGLLVMPGAYDALSARLIAQAGFPAVMAGGFAAAGALLGEPDAGQMTLNDYAAHYGRIAAAIDVPLFVDADTGFGGVNSVRRTVRAFSRAGIAGMFMEDQTMPKRCGYVAGKDVISTTKWSPKFAPRSTRAKTMRSSCVPVPTLGPCSVRQPRSSVRARIARPAPT